jgi:hypothetical protein
MSIHNEHQVSHSQAEDPWAEQCSDFVLVTEGKPPPRIELAKERLLICRLYLGLLRTITDDYGAAFASHSDSLAYRIGIYVFLRTVMCAPVRASQIAHALKLPRISVVRRLEKMIKHGYVERVANAYRVTDKVNTRAFHSRSRALGLGRGQRSIGASETLKPRLHSSYLSALLRF